MPVFLNSIATATPDHDFHAGFVRYCPVHLLQDDRSRLLFRRMAERAQIEHRYSVLAPPRPDEDRLDGEDFYRPGAFPGTRERMQAYERHALPLARRALDQLPLDGVTHLVLATCTGFYAPGLDVQILQTYGLRTDLERTQIGFMGCHAGLTALKIARHVVRSEPDARVLVVCLELCTLHLKPEGTLEEMLAGLLFADGCAAALVSSEPIGLELEGFRAATLPAGAGLIAWHIGDFGFDMHLSGQVPAAIAEHLPAALDGLLEGGAADDIAFWAVHPGGRTVLDAVREGAGLREERLVASRQVLRRFGNLSSASVLFVLSEILRTPGSGGPGVGLAFGPGLTVETLRFRVPAPARPLVGQGELACQSAGGD